MKSLFPLGERDHEGPDPEDQGRDDLREVSAGRPAEAIAASRYVTIMPSAIFPMVACFVELSMSAEYSHVIRPR